MDKYKHFLDSLLKDFPVYDLNKNDKKTIAKDGLESWITAKLVRSSFRRTSLKDTTKEFILKQVSQSVQKKKPIYIIACFGGYKHFWNPCHPQVEWAELFNLYSMAQYVAPILAAYEPGVILEYESEDVIISPMDNYPEEALEEYSKTFRKLLALFSKSLPHNFKVRLIRATEQYDKEKLFEKIEDILPAKKEEWSKFSESEIIQRTHRSDKNIMWKGREDWTGLSEKEKAKKVVDCKILNDAFYDADFDLRPDYFEGDDHIPVVFTFGLGYENVGDWLILASTSSSFVDFWAGRGILEDRGDKMVLRILSQEQYRKIQKDLKKVSFSAIPLENFKEVEVYEGQLNF